jgi:hypothetical protein
MLIASALSTERKGISVFINCLTKPVPYIIFRCKLHLHGEYANSLLYF